MQTAFSKLFGLCLGVSPVFSLPLVLLKTHENTKLARLADETVRSGDSAGTRSVPNRTRYRYLSERKPETALLEPNISNKIVILNLTHYSPNQHRMLSSEPLRGSVLQE